MTNTLENKSKFFAQYWGQHILKATSIEGQFIVGKSFMGKNYPDQYLELIPLSQISDEDLNHVCKIIGEERSNPFSEVGRRNTRSYLHGRMMPAVEFHKHLKVINYLISKGYYIGDGIEVEYGWVKLKGGYNG